MTLYFKTTKPINDVTSDSMKKLILIPALLLLTAFAGKAQTKYEVDASHSSIVFTLPYHFTPFSGSFGVFNGEAMLTDKKDFASAAVKFQVDISSIDTHSPDRDKYMGSSDWLNYNEFQHASFESTSITKNDDGTFSMMGNLTAGGITKEIETQVTLVGQGKGRNNAQVMGLVCEFQMVRSDFKLGRSGGKIGDKVDFKMGLQLIQAK